ncbi:MAG TPA: hypothetical protein PLF26_11620 [Blastocatellia bacterium]|nr:hypothetical protein [Blastocatellia bacterium]
MSVAEDSPRVSLPVVCRLLRTKTAFGGLIGDASDPAPWQSGVSTTAVYWCLSTMETVGPDDVLAHPAACRSDRGCFKDPEE